MSRHAEDFVITDKRQRTATFSRARRAINKEIIFVNALTVNATQESTLINSSVFPNTLTGLRWNFSVAQDGGTGVCFYTWAIVILKESEGTRTMQRADAAEFYQPEVNCLVWGTGIIDNNSRPDHIEGTTKTMRKMMVGDRVVMIYVGSTTNTASFVGAVQMFQKM